jgi:hypothetical protein
LWALPRPTAHMCQACRGEASCAKGEQRSVSGRADAGQGVGGSRLYAAETAAEEGDERRLRGGAGCRRHGEPRRHGASRRTPEEWTDSQRDEPVLPEGNRDRARGERLLTTR